MPTRTELALSLIPFLLKVFWVSSVNETNISHVSNEYDKTFVQDLGLAINVQKRHPVRRYSH